MQMKDIEFILSDSEKLIIELDTPIDEMWSCDESSIFLVKDNARYLLSVDSLYNNMYVLKNVLTRALSNKFHVDPSIKQDIGYLFNEYLQDKPGLTYETSLGYDNWVGMIHLALNHYWAGWIYNQPKSDDIILHITPIYPGNWADPENPEPMISYEEWMSSYKPLFTIKIPRDVAYKWREQAEDIVQRIEKNMAQSKNHACEIENE